ncbi:MAG TPA: hypothetical protein VFS58_01305 [Steroidobacteraceae bacterium]|nr:hypothetical protein [Steroidobacteraceae bacterium]
MQRPEAATLLHAWERGAAQGPGIRGLLLLAVAQPGATAEELAATGIGRRDAVLLDLRELLFGRNLECVAHCAHCGEHIELVFPTDGIRADQSGGETFEAEAGGYRAAFRLPNCGDVLALAGEQDAAAAERTLLHRCLIALTSPEGLDSPIEPPAELVVAIDTRMGELDSQAQVVLDITCAMCTRAARATFDIATHLWSEVETWARTQLSDIHAIASTYGWSEPQILALSPARRRAYLELIEGRA